MQRSAVLQSELPPSHLSILQAHNISLHCRYIAPELLENQGYTKTVDWWTLGVLLYEMMTGLPPFYDENVNTMYQRILRDPLRFPEEMGIEAKSVMAGLLQRDPTRRLGNGGADEIKRHPFFAKHIDWQRCVPWTCWKELFDISA